MKHLIEMVKAEISKTCTFDYTAAEMAAEKWAYTRLGYLTGRIKRYAGTPEEVEKKIRAAVEKKKAARISEQLGKISAVEAAFDVLPNPIIARIDWTRNRTWGYTAKASDNYGHVSDVASGCGYCKASTALAGVLNANLPLLRKLFLKVDAALAANGGKELTSEARRALLGYGAGYGTLPYFEGGVGVSSHVGILERLGYSVTSSGDVVVISEKAQGN